MFLTPVFVKYIISTIRELTKADQQYFQTNNFNTSTKQKGNMNSYRPHALMSQYIIFEGKQ